MTDSTTRVRAILDAATPPDWRAVLYMGRTYDVRDGEDNNALIARDAFEADARAIVLSRNLLPAALDVVEAAQRASDKRTSDSDGFWISAREMRYIDEALDAYHAKERETLG